jgi:hypothetical protein
MEDFFQDYDVRSRKHMALNSLKFHYLARVLHEFAGEVILKNHENKTRNERKEEFYVYQKELDREIDRKLAVITEAEGEISKRFMQTHENFKGYIRTLGLPKKTCGKFFPFIYEKALPDLMFVYDPEMKGSQIISREKYEKEITENGSPSDR